MPTQGGDKFRRTEEGGMLNEQVIAEGMATSLEVRCSLDRRGHGNKQIESVCQTTKSDTVDECMG
jgi:hypothetical protein